MSKDIYHQIAVSFCLELLKSKHTLNSANVFISGCEVDWMLSHIPIVEPIPSAISQPTWPPV